MFCPSRPVWLVWHSTSAAISWNIHLDKTEVQSCPGPRMPLSQHVSLPEHHPVQADETMRCPPPSHWPSVRCHIPCQLTGPLCKMNALTWVTWSMRWLSKDCTRHAPWPQSMLLNASQYHAGPFVVQSVKNHTTTNAIHHNCKNFLLFQNGQKCSLDVSCFSPK